MPLSRLDNFLKNVRGNIIYVNPNDLDATDAVENQGNSLGRPFITIQRALIEAARFSYQQGLDNDRFGKTTVILYPGEHIVDNRPGFIPDDSVSLTPIATYQELYVEKIEWAERVIVKSASASKIHCYYTINATLL